MVSTLLPLGIVAGLVLLIGLVGQYEPATLESQTTIRGGGAETSTQLVPQTYKVSEFTSTAASQSFEVESYEVAPWDAPDIRIHADAAHADPTSVNELEVKRWEFDDVHGNYAFDSEGNLFASDNYRVARIDVSENTQTIWTLPEGWDNIQEFNSERSTVSPSGLYYFLVDENLASLDPDTGIFTRWDVEVDDNHIHSSQDGVYFQPDRTIYIAENRNPQITGIFAQSYTNGIFVLGDGASGLIHTELVFPSGETRTGSGFANSNGQFQIHFDNVFLDHSYILDRESGNYVIKINDMFEKNEATFEIKQDDDGIFHTGHDGNPTTTSASFLQKLDPVIGNVTTFISDMPDPGNLASHDLSDSLYFFTYNSMTKFVPGSGEFIRWMDSFASQRTFQNVDSDLAISDEKIHWSYYSGRNTIKIVTFDTSTAEINEISIPYRCNYYGGVDNITVDSSGTIFFNGCDNGFYKFVPSTNTLTKFEWYRSIIGDDLLTTNSSDIIYWADGRYMGTINFTQPIPIIISGIETISSTEIRITTDHELSGPSNIMEFSVSENTVSNVALSAATIVITVDVPISHGDVITISYFGSSIHSGGAILEAFADRDVTNNIAAEEGSGSPTPQESPALPESSGDQVDEEE